MKSLIASSKQQIAVVLPAYNEEATLAQTMIAFNKELPDAAIYVIDNNSKDTVVTLKMQGS